jgi:hypothetical protein
MAGHTRLPGARDGRYQRGHVAARPLSGYGHGARGSPAGSGKRRQIYRDQHAGDAPPHDQPGDPQPLPARGAHQPIRPLSRRAQQDGGGRRDRAHAPGHQARAQGHRDEGGHGHSGGHRRVRDQLPRQRSQHGRDGHQYAGVVLRRGEPEGPRAPGFRDERVPQGPARRGEEAPGRAGEAGQRVQAQVRGRAAPADGQQPGDAGPARRAAQDEPGQPDEGQRTEAAPGEPAGRGGVGRRDRRRGGPHRHAARAREPRGSARPAQARAASAAQPLQREVSRRHPDEG